VNKVPQNLDVYNRGLILNEKEDESFTIGTMSDDSSLVFNEESLKTKIKKEVTIDIDEKSMTTNIKNKVKIFSDDTGLFSIGSDNTKLDSAESYKVVTKEINLKASDNAKINRVTIIE